MRAQEAMAGYVGNLDYLRMNLHAVVEMARKLRASRSGLSPPAGE